METNLRTHLSFLLLLVLWCGLATAQNENKSLIKTENRVLVSSGGGARGAWGVGLVQALFNQNHGGYDAVFGTSTGSLMSSYILLGSIDHKYLDSLRILYTSVTQKSIFNVSPFKIKINKQDSTATSSIAGGVILNRVICNKPTFGDSRNLLNKLIVPNFDQAKFETLKKHGKYLAVAVTNMTTGDVELVANDQVANALQMDSFIWASACEPLWMSYYTGISPNTGKTGNYVDGGVRDVVPIIQGIQFAVDNHIPKVDVIVNNGRQAIDTNWNPNAKGLKVLSGLLRILDVYDQGTIAKDTLVGKLMAELHQCSASCTECKRFLEQDLAQNAPTHKFNRVKSKDEDDSGDTVHITMYFMDDTTAAKYRDELAFDSRPMTKLVNIGNDYFKTHTDRKQEYHITISRNRFQDVYKHLYKK